MHRPLDLRHVVSPGLRDLIELANTHNFPPNRAGSRLMAKPKKNANNEGTIYQRKDGRWEGSAYVLTTDGTYKRRSVYGKTWD
ncbi:hypothetical protein [Streptomyces sp. NPDC008137]|uniref:hypothetical protein n=1 Tax=Streptomyces sp. NPDC008137 TaxID=3364813 RepID=UPI0036EB8C39